MARNREAYNLAMNEGHEYAWDRNWSGAAISYARALQEFSDDPEAYLNLGFALLQADRLDEALRIYSRAYQLSPEDPIPLEKCAQVLEQMGRLRESAQQYAQVADLHLKQKDIDKAITNWEKATTLTSGLVAIHARLAQAYRRIGDKKRAIYQYLVLAHNFSVTNDRDRALQAAQQVIKIDKNNVEAINAIRAIESGSSVQSPQPIPKTDAQKREAQVERGKVASWTGMFKQVDETESEPDPIGPMGEAMTRSLNMLATYLMTSDALGNGGVDALQAMELQRQGVSAEAISAYRKAMRNIKHPALFMNYGALLLLSEQSGDAIEPLNDAAQDSSLRAGAYHALGRAYYNERRYKSALVHLVKAARMIDSDAARDANDLNLISEVYGTLSQIIESRSDNDKLLMAASKRFLGLLHGKEWKRRLTDIRHQMEQAYREGGATNILEYLAEETNEDLTEIIAKIDRYMRQGLLRLAMDEAHEALLIAPTYLPIHIRMAEIMMIEGRVRQAITKYNIVAKAYLARNENSRASSVLVEVLEKAPLDVELRQSLIKLLEQEERWAEAFDQYLQMAEAYLELGNLEEARSAYTAAERLTNKVEIAAARLIQMKHKMADIDQLRMDMRGAKAVYEDIVAMSRGDEKALQKLITINFDLGNNVEAMNRLDVLLRLYAQRRDVKSIVRLLEQLTRTYQGHIGLHSRLAAIFRQVQRSKDAIEHLDKVVDLHREAGNQRDACEAIKQIIDLNPPNTPQYIEMLRTLGCM